LPCGSATPVANQKETPPVIASSTPARWPTPLDETAGVVRAAPALGAGGDKAISTGGGHRRREIGEIGPGAVTASFPFYRGWRLVADVEEDRVDTWKPRNLLGYRIQSCRVEPGEIRGHPIY
jgi:hypothetical protein